MSAHGAAPPPGQGGETRFAWAKHDRELTALIFQVQGRLEYWSSEGGKR